MKEDSQSHEDMPPFLSGNLVGASPYAVAFFGLPVLLAIIWQVQVPETAEASVG